MGSFTYHVLLLLAVEAALGLAWANWQRARRDDAWRLPVIMIGLTVVRLPYIGAALISSTRWITPESLLPPLERFADTASICLLAWAFVAPARSARRGWDLVLGVNLLLAVAVCAGFTLSWNRTLIDHASTSYSTHWQSTVWSIWQLGLIPLASLAIVVNRREGWGVMLVATALIFVGRPLQIIFPDSVPNLPVWERLANLVAYPLIPVAVYQNISADLRGRFRYLQDVSQLSMEQMKSLLVVVEVSQHVSGTLNLPTVLDRAARGVAHTVNADQCAIALPEEDDPTLMRLAAVYNSERQGRVEARSLPLQYQLTIQRAMRGGRHVVVDEWDNAQLKVLFNLLGSSEAGPLLVQPLMQDGETLGAIVVGNSRSRRRFTAQDAKLCQHLAGHLAGAIQNARRYEAAQTKRDEMPGSLTGQDNSLRANDQAEIQTKDPGHDWQDAVQAGFGSASEVIMTEERVQAKPVEARETPASDGLAEAGIHAKVSMPWPEESVRP